jgi:seryl-tRNA synthetase
MLDIKYIRKNKEAVAEALRKRVPDINLDSVLELDASIRAVMTTHENLLAQRNKLSKDIGLQKRDGTDTSALEAQVKAINAEIESHEAKRTQLEQALFEQMSAIPNMPDPRVPPGGKEANQTVHTWGEKPNLPAGAKDHVQLCSDLGLVDYERGTKLGGAGFWLYTGMGAALEWALINYFCATHYKDGYTFMLPPHLLLPECGFAAGQFPKFVDDVFHLKVEEGDRAHFLLPTSETAILNVYRDEILDEATLPIKAFAYSPCYRSERGGSRTEERGTVRGHQFNKVEMFQFTRPDQAEEALKELVARAQGLLESLGLHYRTTLLAAEDASASMAMTYDVEVWIPSMGIYKEVSSISWAGDYQARRAKIRYRPKGEKDTQFVHTLNASGLATSRLMPAIVEQCQQADGSIKVPKPLQTWLGTDVIRPSPAQKLPRAAEG